MAGLQCGVQLAAAGHDVRLFDKGRGPGGRMATRRMASPALAAFGGEAAFDHGAQYITAKTQPFAAQLAVWEAAGVVARWPAAGERAFVGMPGMNAPLKAMAAEVNVAWGVEITTIIAAPRGWTLMAVGGAAIDNGFDALVVAVPPEQAARLLAQTAAQSSAMLAAGVQSSACWTLMAAFAERLPASDDVLRDCGSIGWAARNSAKPGRRALSDVAAETWVVQAGPEWSAAHIEDDPAVVADALMAALADRLGRLPQPLVKTAHRWRYAQSSGFTDSPNEGAIWLPEQRLGVCGDWLLGPRVEAAWTSGTILASLIGQ